MKTNKLQWMAVLLTALCFWTAQPARSQIKLGVKGGLNVTSLSFSSDVYQSDNRTGFFIGPMAEFTVPLIGIGLDVAALYNQTRSQIANGHSISSDNIKSIEVPVNLKWSFGAGRLLGAYIAVGPQFGWNIGNSTFGQLIDDHLRLKGRYTTFNAGAGIHLLRHLQAGINYNFSLNKTGQLQTGNEEFKVKRNNWQVSLAYLF